jgi:hypothetical protein
MPQEKVMKSVALTPAAVPVIAAEIRARRSVALKVNGKCVAKVEPIVSITKKEAAQILREIGEADKGDDWAEFASWN